MTELLKLLENDPRLTPEKLSLMLEKEVGAVFLRVLEDAGVYKRTPAGQAALGRFLASLS